MGPIITVSLEQFERSAPKIIEIPGPFENSVRVCECGGKHIYTGRIWDIEFEKSDELKGRAMLYRQDLKLSRWPRFKEFYKTVWKVETLMLGIIDNDSHWNYRKGLTYLARRDSRVVITSELLDLIFAPIEQKIRDTVKKIGF